MIQMGSNEKQGHEDAIVMLLSLASLC